MKRIEKKLLPIVAFSMILLASNLGTVFASAAINEQDSSDAVLPDYLLRLSEYLSNGNASELARIRQEMIEQEKIKQDRIKSTNGAVLDFLSRVRGRSSYWCMETIEGSSPDQYDIYNNLIGHIDDPEEMTFWPDNDCALLETFGWNKDDEDPEWGEACANGYMDDWAIGDIYIGACQGPNSESDPPWSNYVNVWVMIDYGTPYYVGYEKVRTTSLSMIYIGSFYNSFNCIAVACVTPAQAPIYYEPIILNSVYIDSVVVVWPDP